MVLPVIARAGMIPHSATATKLDPVALRVSPVAANARETSRDRNATDVVLVHLDCPPKIRTVVTNVIAAASPKYVTKVRSTFNKYQYGFTIPIMDLPLPTSKFI